MGDQAKGRVLQTQHQRMAGMAVIAANLHISGTSLCGWEVCQVPNGEWEHVIIWPHYRVVSGDMKLPACKYSQESGLGPLVCRAQLSLGVCLCTVLYRDLKLCAGGRMGVGGTLWTTFQGCIRGNSSQAGRTPN